MAKDTFNDEGAKRFLEAKEQQEKEEQETTRKNLLQQVTAILRKEFEGSTTEVYLIGSILKPFSFSSRSDVDIVLKNYAGDRFEFWAKIEKQIGKKVEIILFEKCHFQDFVLTNGLKVV